MAGEDPVGSDELTDKLTEPRPKPSVYDIWNAAFRGFVPHGLNRKGDSSAPTLPMGADDARPFSETEQTIVEPSADDKPGWSPVLVTIVDDVSAVRGTTGKYFATYQVGVGGVSPVAIVNNDFRRRRVVLTNVGPGKVYVGATESVDTATGVVIPVDESATREFFVTTPMWAIQEPAQAGLAVVHVYVEYEKER